MKTDDLARLILEEATLLAVDITPALRALDQHAGGHPAQTPMAGPASPNNIRTYDGWCDETERHVTYPGVDLDDGTRTEDRHSVLNLRCDKRRPCPDHDTKVKLTPTEAGSLTTDQALTDSARLTKLIRAIERDLREAAGIAHRHATIRTDDTTVAARLAAVDKIWCTNCAHHGFNNPRRTGGTVCDYCATFKANYPQYKTYPPKPVLERWTTTGKCGPTDVHRIMRDLKATAKQTSRQTKNPDWRDQPDPARRIEADPLTAEQRRQKRLTA